MTDVWSSRADAYRASPTHAVRSPTSISSSRCASRTPARRSSTSRPAEVTSTRRLRERGAEVVSLDPSPGMHADVLAPAEHIPFADGSFDCVVTRIAPHHFADDRRGDRRDGPRDERRGRDRGHALPVGGARGGREAPRPVARAQLLRGGVARPARRAQASRSSASSTSRRRTRPTTGSRARTAPARRPSACESCSHRCPRTAAARGATRS